MTVTYIGRSMYGAGPVTVGHAVPLSQFVGLVVHHTVMVMPDYDHDGMVTGDIDDIIRYMQQLQHARPDLGDDNPYSFNIFEGATENDCIVAEGRGLGRTGAHTISYNSTRYGCAFAGDYTAIAPTSGMWDGVRWVGTQLNDPQRAMLTLEHRDVYPTACPGASTPAPALAQPPFVGGGVPLPLPTPLPDPPFEEDDMALLIIKPEEQSGETGPFLVDTISGLCTPILAGTDVTALKIGGARGPLGYTAKSWVELKKTLAELRARK